MKPTASTPPGPDTRQSLGVLLRVASLLSRQHLLRTSLPDGARPIQGVLLNVIKLHAGSSTTCIAQLMQLKRENIVPLLDELEQNHLVRRTVNPGDRRANVWFLTPKGAAQERSASRVLLQHEDVLAQYLGGSKARDTMVAMLRRLIERLEDSQGPADAD